jgi:hypothetical protein
MLCALTLTVPAHAYVDPNAAGFLPHNLTLPLLFFAAVLTFLSKQVGAVIPGLSQQPRQQVDA